MKKRIIILNLVLIIGMLLASCYPEQEVAPIDPPGDNPTVTITPGGDYSSVQEGDTLVFEISVDKMVQNPISFEIALDEGATADDHDFVSDGATLAAYSNSTTLQVVVTPDLEVESAESLAFTIVPDFHWDWQLNPEGDKEPVNATVKDLTFTLDWSTGTYEGQDLCEWDVDLDLLAENAAGDESNYEGATAACPVETGSLGSFPDGTYFIYVDFWDSGIPVGAGATIPYVVSFSDNSGGFHTIEGSFNSDEAGAATHTVGHVVVSGGSYTLYDANGNEIGSI